MKKLFTIALLSIATIGFSQNQKPTFEAEGDLVKATYYHEDGSISTQGFFKDKKLTGKWVRFDKKGNKTQLAFYKDGKKTGKWFIWGADSLKEITYSNNAVQDVSLWKAESKIAANK
ncbi:nicotinic acid mononucleotide adenyltransferase [uncultured Polaribacter sp.]|uniref:toxin-antitoxin system YwqK family antitoxin n=1 Tax=uncultured Polaribacter sp. TaxID=174711 RepID=UPI00260C8C54|nr:nicotinic acid mononucleotide adenyltransferase [uncultured Polaribacter sp.]